MPISFSIDASDRLVSVNQRWTEFALANDGKAVLPDRVLGRDLWTQISDAAVRSIYQMILKRARGGHPVKFQYRCDSATHRRTFEMIVARSAPDQVRFDSYLVLEEVRPSVSSLLEENRPRDDRRLVICSWCQRVALEDGKWVSVEEGVQRMGYLKNTTFPMLSHGICPECSETAFGAFGDDVPDLA